MSSERDDALVEIAALARRHGIGAEEIAARLAEPAAAAPTPTPQGTIVKTLLGYTGGVFIFAGIGLLVSMLWPDLGGAERVVITLGPGIAAFALGCLWHRDARFARAATPLFLVAGFLLPTGLFVFLDEFVPRTGQPELAALVVFGALVFQHGLAYVQLRRASLLFLAIAFWAGALGSAMAWLDIDADVSALTLGVSLLFLARHASGCGRGGVAPFWYFAGGGLLLAGAFGLVKDGPLELGYLGLNGGLIYLSILLSSRSLLFVSVAGLIGYLSYFTYEHFADVIGWPVALIVMGLVMIAVSAYAFRLGQGMTGTGPKP
jgi:hypothetical protein